MNAVIFYKCMFQHYLHFIIAIIFDMLYCPRRSIMNEVPDISVVIPVHNVEKYLSGCLFSDGAK